MAKGLAASIFLVAALCFSSLLSSANAINDYLFVEGSVYCDHCRVGFQTQLSTPMGGAKVILECRSRQNRTLTFTVEAKTNENGRYSIPVEGEHEEDICEVSLVESSDPECTEQLEMFGDEAEKARVMITKDVGIVDPVRLANPLGFMTKKANPECFEVLKELGLVPDEGHADMLPEEEQSDTEILS